MELTDLLSDLSPQAEEMSSQSGLVTSFPVYTQVYF